MSPTTKCCEMAIVLATGLNGLGAVRSLDAANISSVVITGSKKDHSAYSQLPKLKYVIPEDERWEENVLSLLERLALADRPPIIACSDRAANFLSDYREALQSYCRLLLPEPRLVQAMNDKRVEVELMQQHGISLPRSITRIAPDTTDHPTYPAIVKPRTFEGYQTISAKNIIVSDRREWGAFLQRYGDKLDEFIVQSVIAGADTNLWVCNATFDKQSNLVCAFSFRRLGTSPSHFGVTSLARSEVNERVIALSEKVGRILKYVGPAMFEFKYDPQTQDYLYIETNPRLGMCNWFDTQCGINNVAASCYVAGDCEYPDAGRQLENRYFWNVTSDLIARLEDRENIGSILVLYFKILLKKKIWSTYRWNDLRPFIYITVSDIKVTSKRAIRFFWRKARLS